MLTIEEIQTSLGLSKVPETIEELNTEVNAKFIPRAEAHKDAAIKGTVLGSYVTSMKREAKAMGIEFTEADKFDKDDVMGFNKSVFAKLDAKVKDAESKVGQPNDEVTKTLKAQLEQANLKAGDFENKWKTVGAELETEKSNASNTIKSFKLATKFNDIKAKTLVYGPDVNELTKKGFESILKDSLTFDIDENDNVIALDAKTKLQIANPKKAGTFYTTEEILREKAIEHKVLNINPQGGRVITPIFKTAGQLQAEAQPLRKASSKVVRA